MIFQKIFSRRNIKFFLIGTIAVTGLLWGCSYWITKSVSMQLFNDLTTIPENKVGLVLGTSKKTGSGSPNVFFVNRIKAAAQLYKAGKIKHILVSGDNRRHDYDEPTDMKLALIAEGVPDSCITLDYAGLRTFDSVVRCYEIFGQKNFTIISQDFQNERALFVANHTPEINAIAYNAKSVSFKYHPKTFVREIGARVRCVLDVYILNTRPHHLGKKEIIP